MSGCVPSPRQAMSVTVVADRGFMIVVGGESATQVFNDIFLFHFELNQWSRLLLPVPMYPRMAAGLFLWIDPSTSNLHVQPRASGDQTPYGILSNTTLYTFGGRVQIDDGSKVPTSDVVSIPLSDRWVQSVPDLDAPTTSSTLRTPNQLDLWHQFRSRDVDKLNVKLAPFNVRAAASVPSFLFHMKNNAPAFNWDGNPSTLTFVERLGSGTYGEVFLVSYEDIFAICKVVKLKASLAQSNPAQYEAALNALTTQVVLLSRCRNASLVQYYGAVPVDATTLWILTEYFPAGSAKELIKSHAASEKFVATAAAQALLGLTYLHSHGIVARSLKASNLLVTEKGEVKISDYGLSPWIDEICESKFVVEFSGSYSPPECQAPGSNWTPKSDIYSLGIALTEIAENTPPFKQLQKPKKWSTEMSEFLAACCTGPFIKRPDAINILQHPFLDSARSSAVIELLAIRRHTQRKTALPDAKYAPHERQHSQSTSPILEKTAQKAPEKSAAKEPSQDDAMAHAVRQLVRRYREELFRESLPLHVAERVDRKFEDLEGELLYLLASTSQRKSATSSETIPAPSSSSTGGASAFSPSSSGSPTRKSVYAATNNPLMTEAARKSMFVATAFRQAGASNIQLNKVGSPPQ